MASLNNPGDSKHFVEREIPPELLEVLIKDLEEDEPVEPRVLCEMERVVSKLADERTTVLRLKLDTERLRNEKLRKALGKLTLGWLYWPATDQPDPRNIMYQSRTLDEIENMAKEAMK